MEPKANNGGRYSIFRNTCYNQRDYNNVLQSTYQILIFILINNKLKLIMKPLLVLFAITFFILSCGYDVRSKKYSPSLTSICGGHIFIETYPVFGEGGAIGGSVYSDYLTDSLNFRKYIGTYDPEVRMYSYECNGDNVKIYKVLTRGTWPTNLEKTMNFSLKDLKQKKIFE